MDFLPTELPKDASDHFGNKLYPFIKGILFSKYAEPLEQQNLPPEIERAVIANNGDLTAKFKYIGHLRRANEEMNKMEGYRP